MHPPRDVPGLPARRPAGVGRSGFFHPAEPDAPWTGHVELRRFLLDDDPRRESFRLGEPVGYWDEHVGGIVVPADPEEFATDLTSVPWFLQWLVPRSGQHLPAALVHDGLVDGDGEGTCYLARRRIDRVTADRIFRDGLRDLGVSWLRRWLMWAGVSLATMLCGPLRRTWYPWLVTAVLALTVVVFGTLSTVDLLDRAAPLPWMGARPWWQETLTGAAAAVLVPALLSPLWGRRWREGLVAGACAAFLFHVSVAVILTHAVFSALDALTDRRPGEGLGWAALAALIVGAAALVVHLVG